ncbi:MAG: DUF3617 domain-containing protein [Pseudomonadota bacterium]
MKYILTPALAAFALTACGGGVVDADADGDGNITSEEMAEAVAASGDEIRPEPGKYSTTMDILEIDMPGAPEGMKDMMKSAMGQSIEYCVTPEMAEKGYADSIKEGQNGDCTVSTFTLDGGDLDMAMTCKTGEGGAGSEMNMALNGAVTPTSSDMTMTMDGEVPELGAMSMKVAYKQNRIGDCDE